MRLTQGAGLWGSEFGLLFFIGFHNQAPTLHLLRVGSDGWRNPVRATGMRAASSLGWRRAAHKRCRHARVTPASCFQCNVT